ncbi:uncharacterized protein LOC128206394 [Mya arenaria]|uniref:uncharacterized protein LOC128206394 n=1 Tax=Mya arenaria TaxID=6604 RepID=UPI0022E67238|nr:uncharacterized protein LOC128206394 [Mya arenaria]
MESQGGGEPTAPDTETLMEEALKILTQEGFKLPGDVVETLHTVGRSNAAARHRGSLRGHRMCEVQSNTRKTRNVRETSAKRRKSEDIDDSDKNGSTKYDQSEKKSSEKRAEKCDRHESPADEVFTTTGSSGGGNTRGGPEERRRLEREESGESSSTCSASTVREKTPPPHPPEDRRRHDSGSSIASSASTLNRKIAQGRLDSVGSDTGYNTSIENAMQTHEARAENLKNLNKDIENKLSGRFNGGLRRDISRDSGFTETMTSPQQSKAVENRKPQTMANTSVTQDFNDISVSNSDVSERFVSTDAGDAHTVTSTASDLTAADMTSKNDEITADGTAVSSVAKLENQESNSTMLRATNKMTDADVSREDDYESVNKTSKSSRTDSLATTENGLTTAASRHAASVEQGLYKESTKLGTSKDGQHATSEMKIDQQLARNQELNNVEKCDDGTSKTETKNVSEKSLTSKSRREEKIGSENGPVSGSLVGTQNIDQKSRTSDNKETRTLADGTVITRSNELSTKSENEQSESEQRTEKRNPDGSGSSVDVVKKSDTFSVNESSKKKKENKETESGTSHFEETEDSKSVSSSFAGQCESTEVKNGVKLHRTKSSENSSESTVKSSRSVSSFSNRGSGIPEEHSTARSIGNRRVSDVSNASNVTNTSGLSGDSRENINPPSYDETMSNLSRKGSLSSVFSRQDSSASSIASSASAFNERQRQKDALRAMERQDSETKRKEFVDDDYRGRLSRETSRQDSFSSDSTVGGGNIDNFDRNYDVMSYPTRRNDVSAYTRSFSDSSQIKPKNRRATLHGDVVLSNRELTEARQAVRSNLRGHDDMFMDLNRSAFDDVNVDFDGLETTSFKQEVMDIVNKFFDDDDDHFGSSLMRRNRVNRRNVDDFGTETSGKRYSSSTRDRGTSRQSDVNPYLTRENLSMFRDGSEYRGIKSDVEYAASDSAFLASRRDRGRRTGSDLVDDFSDTASDSGFRQQNRFGNRSELNTAGLLSPQLTSGSATRLRNSGYSSALEKSSVSETADDRIRSAGKSISRQRDNGRSMPGDRELQAFTNKSADKLFEGDRRYENANRSSLNRVGKYSEFLDRDFGMGDTGSTCNSERSREQHVNGRLKETASSFDEYKPKTVRTTSSGYDEHESKNQNREDQTSELERKQRIDQALSWIRGELGVLRTQDRVLMSQFQRCQDSIEELKRQRPWYEVFSDEEEGDEETGGNWQDWEIDEFEKRDGRDSRMSGREIVHRLTLLND